MKKVLGALMIGVFLVATPAKAQVVSPEDQALIESLQQQIALLIQLLDLMNQFQAEQNALAGDIGTIISNQQEQQASQQPQAESNIPTGTITLIDPSEAAWNFSPRYVDINDGDSAPIRVLVNNGGNKNTTVLLDTPEGTKTMMPGASLGKWKHGVSYTPSSEGIKHFTVRVPEFNLEKEFDIEFIHRDWVEEN